MGVHPWLKYDAIICLKHYYIVLNSTALFSISQILAIINWHYSYVLIICLQSYINMLKKFFIGGIWYMLDNNLCTNYYTRSAYNKFKCTRVHAHWSTNNIIVSRRQNHSAEAKNYALPKHHCCLFHMVWINVYIYVFVLFML